MVQGRLQVDRCRLQENHGSESSSSDQESRQRRRLPATTEGAPAHTSKVVQDWMNSNMTFWPKDFWSSQPSDLNLLDYSVWPHIESEACKDRLNNTEELKASVNRAWTLMRKDYVRKVRKDFRPRLSRVIAANGGRIE